MKSPFARVEQEHKTRPVHMDSNQKFKWLLLVVWWIA